MKWAGVMPAITTPFTDDDRVDLDFVKMHVGWLVDNGATGIVALGSLGEGNTLTFDEKCTILEACVEGVADRVPVLPGVASLSTSAAVRLAKAAEGIGCAGLMVLPPYVYRGDWRETREHFAAVFDATELPCMLYNNPIAYGTDVLPEQVETLAGDFDNLHAVKESSGDVRRITAIRSRCGDRLAVFVGLDDLIVEGVRMGAVGWIAGLVNALPRESVVLFDHAMRGEMDEAFDLYRWFLPLLRLDTGPKFVQLIKLVQQEVGMGSENVRAPRLRLEGAEREEALALIRGALVSRARKVKSQQ